MTIVINGTTGISGVDGSAGTPAVQGTDTNTGVFYPAADTVAVATNGSERMRVDSSGNVGIGTSSPGTSRLKISGATDVANIAVVNGASYAVRLGSNTGVGAYIEGVDITGVSSYQPLVVGGSTLTFAISGAAQAAITAAGLFQFNSGYGSVATAYGCRAWVSFNGSAGATIRASANVTSVTYISAGTYRVNFTNAMPDANYAPIAMAQGYPAVIDGAFTQTTSAVQFYVFYASSTGGGQTKFDANPIGFAAFR